LSRVLVLRPHFQHTPLHATFNPPSTTTLRESRSTI
jgi:hypothetical protein